MMLDINICDIGDTPHPMPSAMLRIPGRRWQCGQLPAAFGAAHAAVYRHATKGRPHHPRGRRDRAPDRAGSRMLDVKNR